MATANVALTLNTETLEEVRKREEGLNRSWVISRDLNRLYSLYDYYRPQVLAGFSVQELLELKTALNPLRSSLRTCGAVATKSIIASLTQERKLTRQIMQKIEGLALIEFLTLVDSLDLGGDQEHEQAG